MQPGSMVSIGPIQSIQVDQSVHTHSHGYGHLGIGGGGAGMGYNAEMADMHTHHNNHNHSHHHNQQLLPYEHRLSARMDDLLDQMFSLSPPPPPPPPPPPSSSSSSSWYEITGMNNNNNAANGALPMESTEQAQEDIGGGGGLPLRSPSGDWCQPYMSGLLSMNHTPKPETFMLHNGMDANLIGKRPRQDDICAEATGSYLGPSQVCRVAMGQASRQHSMESKPHIQGGQSVPVAYHGTPQPPNASTGAPARPRVRARRGQATDPHSIAERLRRERIAERMKALQELVPNSNKTDKASMLDEIIEYVKFLQLQVKVLSMSRLGSASAVAPLIADLPLENNLGESTLNRMAGASASSQDAMAAFERQVAQLLEEDMGSCMQFLQLKGLCLMPISLASAVSSTGTRSQTGINPSADMSSSSITTVSCGKALTTVQPSSGSDRASSDSSIKGANAVRSLNPDKVEVMYSMNANCCSSYPRYCKCSSYPMCAICSSCSRLYPKYGLCIVYMP